MALKVRCATLLLADTVIREAGTGKMSLIGCFGSFFSRSFPLTVGRFSVFAMVFGIEGRKIKLTASLVPRGKGEEALATCEVQMERNNIVKFPKFHINSIDIDFPFRGVVIPQPGYYDLLLHWEGNLIATRELAANLLSPKKP